MEKICAPLVRILQRGDSFSKSEATRALCSITVNSDGRAAVAAAGAISPLLDLVARGGDHLAKRNALQTLTNLMYKDDTMRVAIFRAGCIRPVVMLLRSDDDLVKQQAAGLLKNLVYGTAIETQARLIRDAVVAAGAVPALIEIVNTGSELSKAQATATLANLAAGHYDHKGLIAAAGLVPLVDLVRDGSDSCKRSAAMALRNLCTSSTEFAQLSDNRVAIAAAGAIPLLVAAETGSHAGVKEQASAALHNLGLDNVDNQVAIAKARGAEALVRIARRGRIELPWQGRVHSYLPSAGASERVARLLAKRRGAIIRKILEDALLPEIATHVVAPFLGRWGGCWP